jgi:hypothetical protein
MVPQNQIILDDDVLEVVKQRAEAEGKTRVDSLVPKAGLEPHDPYGGRHSSCMSVVREFRVQYGPLGSQR